jgi:methyltransferase-like protein
MTTPVARWQACQGWQVTSGRHESLTFDEPARDILQHLDGRHDRAALLKVFVDAVDRGSMAILVDGVPATRGNDVLGVLERRLDKCLASLAINALLIG